MAYCTNTDVKTYLGVSGTGDDTLITALITRAQKAIESYTGRVFEHGATGAARKFTVGKDTDGGLLLLDEDLCEIAASGIVTNADAVGGGTALATTDYITHPRNRTPYYAIEILGSSSQYWRYTSDAANGVTVTGKWAYSATPPADIVHACVRLAAYFYQQKDSQVFDVTAMPDAGVMTIPQGIPKDVKMLLDPYRKARL